MKKLISYVLWGNHCRYLHNIPYLLIANSCIYPDFTMRFYVHKESMGYTNTTLLEKVAEEFSNVELEIIDTSIKGTQLSILRMKPLWEEDIDYLFCRDIDYAVSTLEKKSVDYFLCQKECIIQGIRSYIYHKMPLMGGLTGFDVKQVYEKIKLVAPTFEDYVEWGIENVYKCGKGQWGCDQSLLMEFFKYMKLYKCVLNCPLGQAPSVLKNFLEMRLCIPLVYQLQMELDKEKRIQYQKLEYDAGVLQYLNELYSTPSVWVGFPPFVGRAWTCNSTQLKTLLFVVDNEMSEMIAKHILG